MLAHTTWFFVFLGSSVAVLGACQLAAYADSATRGWRSRLAIVGGCVAALLVLALVWHSRGIAKIDGDVVAKLVGDRNASLNGIFSTVTTMGDVVPSFLLASLLAIAYYQQTRRIRGFVLGLMVLVQLVIQDSMPALFHDVTLTVLDPSVPIGGSGTIPSGSVSRLLSIFLLAATLWHGYGSRAERVLLGLAPLVVMTEIVSRLYLGRHLLADIVAGLLFGVILTIVFRWVLQLAEESGSHRARRPRRAPDAELGQPSSVVDKNPDSVGTSGG
jgi:membrane-associated phospholipid phosphatase